MIRDIELDNFKCFPSLQAPLGKLTLLTGLNGMGKSTVMQAILAILQSSGEALSLNGELVQLGTAADVLYEGAQSETIGIRLGDELYLFDYARPEANELPLADDRTLDSPLGGRPWQYLNCERVGPRSSFAMSDAVVRGRRQIGVRGEYAAHFLSVWGDERVAKSLRHAGTASRDLRSQIDAWMGEVSPGAHLGVVHHTEMDLVRLSVSFVENRVRSRSHRPTNVGFGITYILPVIVAGLAAKPGALLMLENPEAHLHPRGQARMGEFLARVAANDVQVIIETHSDHLLNGVRLAVHGGQLAPDDIAIHYFERTVVDERITHRTTSPRIDRDGRIDQWPAGFFDEWDNALDKLLMPPG